MTEAGGRRLNVDDVIGANPVQLLESPDGRLLARTEKGLVYLGGLPKADLERVLSCVGSGKRLGDVVAELAQEYEEEDVYRILGALAGDLIHVRGAVVQSAKPSEIQLFGSGETTEMLTKLLRRRGLAVSLKSLGSPVEPLKSDDVIAVVLDEGVYESLYDLVKAAAAGGATLLPLVFDRDGVSLGPVQMGVGAACFGCYLSTRFKRLGIDNAILLETLSQSLAQPAHQAVGAEAMLHAMADELVAVSKQTPNRRDGVLHCTASGRRWERQLSVVADCPLCGGDGAKTADKTQPSPNMPPGPSARLSHGADNPIRSVGILGGGTAGYLAALALARKRPELKVTLIESSAIPVIGVGEATTPSMPQFLHADLGLDIVSFFEAVRPTLKLGIRFEWGRCRDSFFNYPFGSVNLLEPLSYQGSVTDASMASILMDRGRIPIHAHNGQVRSLLDRNVAYHVENRRFAAWLKDSAGSRIEQIDAQIAAVETAADGSRVTGLKTTDGRTFQFDLYLDCSGFRSLLMGEAMGSQYDDFSQNLFTDRAVAATVPHGGVIQPYTTAETMSAGWCWNTPMPDCDHRGYVFSSAFQSDTEAEAEMRAKNPGMGDARIIRFRSGRRRHFWKGNVVALGNAYGFVEPLESTALHMLIRQIGMVIHALPTAKGETGLPRVLNRKANNYWDYLAWFLAIHFKFNQRMDTPFWRACRQDIDVSAYGELLEWYRERGPLSYLPQSEVLFDYPDPLWGAEGIDTILLGQGVETRLPQPRMSELLWRKRREQSLAWAADCWEHGRALELLRRHPHLLTQFAAQFQPAFPVGR